MRDNYSSIVTNDLVIDFVNLNTILSDLSFVNVVGDPKDKIVSISKDDKLNVVSVYPNEFDTSIDVVSLTDGVYNDLGLSSSSDDFVEHVSGNK